MALFQIWNYNFFKGEFYINREEVMAFSKIGSKSTYHRCIKELSHWNYLLYKPSHNPFKGSLIKMFDFGTSSEQALYPCNTNIRTSTGQALVPILKHIKTITNGKNEIKQQNFKNSNFLNPKTEFKRQPGVPNRDNLKTAKDKDYNEPL